MLPLLEAHGIPLHMHATPCLENNHRPANEIGKVSLPLPLPAKVLARKKDLFSTNIHLVLSVFFASLTLYFLTTLFTATNYILTHFIFLFISFYILTPYTSFLLFFFFSYLQWLLYLNICSIKVGLALQVWGSLNPTMFLVSSLCIKARSLSTIFLIWTEHAPNVEWYK